MDVPNKDEVQGKYEQAKGAVKENVGDAIGNERMQSEGAAERAEGNVREGFGTARRKVGEAVEETGEDIKR